MIKNVIFDVGQVLVAWEPVEAMRALGMDEETVRAVADATVHTSDWDEADRGALSDEELLTGFIRKAPAYDHRSGISGSMWTGRFIRFRMSGNGCGR